MFESVVMTLLLLPLSYYVPLNVVGIIINMWSVFSYFGLYLFLIITAYVIAPFSFKAFILLVRIFYWALNKIIKRLANKFNLSLKKRPLDPEVLNWIDNKVDGFCVTF